MFLLPGLLLSGTQLAGYYDPLIHPLGMSKIAVLLEVSEPNKLPGTLSVISIRRECIY